MELKHFQENILITLFIFLFNITEILSKKFQEKMEVMLTNLKWYSNSFSPSKNKPEFYRIPHLLTTVSYRLHFVN